MIELPYTKNITLSINFTIGETVSITGWGYTLDGNHVLEDVRLADGRTETGVLVKVSGYGRWIDSNWINKIEKTLAADATDRVAPFVV